jgi:GT2 family glycosyltransferase
VAEQTPRLSIVIAARNEERYLPDQLIAIQTQAIQPDEIVLVDDGSTDGTLAIMAQFAAARGNVRIISLPTSVGCARATNRGVAESTGTHVYIASANDVMLPATIRAVAAALRSFPEAHLLAGDVSGIHLGWGDRAGDVVTPSFVDADAIARMLGSAGIVHAAGAVISRAAWDRYGGWDPASWPYSETLTWHVTACRYGLVYVPHAFAWVRPHGDGDAEGGSVCLDHMRRRPLMERAAEFVLGLEEPTRSRLGDSHLWTIREWAPDMAPMLESLSIGRETARRAREAACLT